MRSRRSGASGQGCHGPPKRRFVRLAAIALNLRLFHRLNGPLECDGVLVYSRFSRQVRAQVPISVFPLQFNVHVHPHPPRATDGPGGYPWPVERHIM
ncbi:hypothetical protein NHX12_031942 [Muraenolepis orangiensis]|uniref:Uncharacterized protein n=1 Tax=Muraenolepis orangiensis TaxID=630683 RepID=A0A9Q0IJE9_9TELE|nr:hypothetical protein NHX12_031942 [Muraenolepis orangiensis]